MKLASNSWCQSTLHNKISGKSPIVASGHSGPTSILGEQAEEVLVNWIPNCAKMEFPVNKNSLLNSVKQIVKEANLKTPFTDNMPSKKWYYSFLKSHKELSVKHGEYVNKARGNVSEQKIRNWFEEVTALSGEEIVESGFFLAPKGDLIIGPRGQNVYNESSNNDKENITTLFAVNAAGKFALPFTLYKYVGSPLI